MQRSSGRTVNFSNYIMTQRRRMNLAGRSKTRMQILIELCEDVNGCPPTSKADKYMINLLDKLREVYDDICQEIKIAVEHKPRNNKLINKLSRKEEHNQILQRIPSH